MWNAPHRGISAGQTVAKTAPNELQIEQQGGLLCMSVGRDMVQESLIARHGIHSRGNAPSPPPPALDVAAPSTAPVLGMLQASTLNVHWFIYSSHAFHSVDMLRCSRQPMAAQQPALPWYLFDNVYDPATCKSTPT